MPTLAKIYVFQLSLKILFNCFGILWKTVFFAEILQNTNFIIGGARGAAGPLTNPPPLNPHLPPVEVLDLKFYIYKLWIWVHTGSGRRCSYRTNSA